MSGKWRRIDSLLEGSYPESRIQGISFDDSFSMSKDEDMRVNKVVFRVNRIHLYYK